MTVKSYKKNGKTYYKYDFKLPGYNRQREQGFTRKSEAVAAEQERMKLIQEINVTDGKTPFHKYYTEYCEIHVKPRTNKDESYNRYFSTLKATKDYFHDTPIMDITTDDYQKFINDMALNLTRDTVKRYHQQLSGCFEYAFRQNIITKDITYKAHIWGAKPTKQPDEKYIERNDYRRLLAYLAVKFENDIDIPLSYYAIQLAAVTGGRISEVLAIKPSDFNFKDKTLFLPGTKTDTSPRTIKVDDYTLKLFKRLILDQSIPLNELMFNNGMTDKPISGAAVNDVLKKIIKELNIKPQITMHGLRHTHASILISDNVRIEYVSQRLGHKSIETTMSIYYHFLKEKYLEAEENALKSIASDVQPTFSR